MKIIKLMLISFFVGSVLALPVASLAGSTVCVDCYSSYTYGSFGRETTCTLVGHNVYEQSCEYSCAPGAGPEPYIETFCEFDK